MLLSKTITIKSKCAVEDEVIVPMLLKYSPRALFFEHSPAKVVAQKMSDGKVMNLVENSIRERLYFPDDNCKIIRKGNQKPFEYSVNKDFQSKHDIGDVVQATFEKDLWRHDCEIIDIELLEETLKFYYLIADGDERFWASEEDVVKEL